MTCVNWGNYKPSRLEAEIDLATVSREIDATERKLAEVQVRIKGYLEELGLDGREAPRA